MFSSKENYKALDFKFLCEIHLVQPMDNVSKEMQLRGRGPRAC